jgi:hypothetical protein
LRDYDWRGVRTGINRGSLALSSAERAYLVVRQRLARGVEDWRRRRVWAQADLAEALESSQSRVARMEAADPSVSLDLLIRALLVLGASRRDLARIIDGNE